MHFWAVGKLKASTDWQMIQNLKFSLTVLHILSWLIMKSRRLVESWRTPIQITQDDISRASKNNLEQTENEHLKQDLFRAKHVSFVLLNIHKCYSTVTVERISSYKLVEEPQ